MAKLNKAILQRDYFIDPATDLSASEVVAYLAALFRVAAVGGVTPDEKEFEELLTSHLGVSATTVRRARSKASESSLATEVLVAEIGDSVFRVCLFRDALRMAMADKRFTRGERRIVRELGAAVGLSQRQLDEVTAIVREQMDLDSRFARVLRAAR